ncbi:MAG: SUMF1/EgtB/PvdO family nonheme iron enzyme [Polyangiaceae bacterium]
MHRRVPLLMASTLVAMLTACNALFGVDGLTYDGAGGVAPGPTTTTAGGETATGGDNPGGQGGAPTGGTGGSGGVAVTPPPSCEGLPPLCGPNADEDCCASPTVIGGTFERSNDDAYPATVSDFRLDRFEVTVGRFRRFVDAYPASQPAPGDGAHPLIPASGWTSKWDSALPDDPDALRASLQCDPYATWTDATGTQEALPVTCVPWVLAFAFCAWDGGRLPTEAEWNYAAAAGAEQRLYPWGNQAPTDALAVHGCMGDGSSGCELTDILAVGSRSPAGDGKDWLDGAHADLAGNLWEWVLDAANCNNCCDAGYETNDCVDCAYLSENIGPEDHVRRGGCFASAPIYLETTVRYNGNPGGLCVDLYGLRCARDL